MLIPVRSAILIVTSEMDGMKASYISLLYYSKASYISLLYYSKEIYDAFIPSIWDVTQHLIAIKIGK